MSSPCTHLESVVVTELPARIAGCEDCLASGGSWVHLRMCRSSLQAPPARPSARGG